MREERSGAHNRSSGHHAGAREWTGRARRSPVLLATIGVRRGTQPGARLQAPRSSSSGHQASLSTPLRARLVMSRRAGRPSEPRCPTRRGAAREPRWQRSQRGTRARPPDGPAIPRHLRLPMGAAVPASRGRTTSRWRSMPADGQRRRSAPRLDAADQPACVLTSTRTSGRRCQTPCSRRRRTLRSRSRPPAGPREGHGSMPAVEHRRRGHQQVLG